MLKTYDMENRISSKKGQFDFDQFLSKATRALDRQEYDEVRDLFSSAKSSLPSKKADLENLLKSLGKIEELSENLQSKTKRFLKDCESLNSEKEEEFRQRYYASTEVRVPK